MLVETPLCGLGFYLFIKSCHVSSLIPTHTNQGKIYCGCLTPYRPTKPEALHLKLQAQIPTPQAVNPKPYTQTLQPQTSHHATAGKEPVRHAPEEVGSSFELLLSPRMPQGVSNSICLEFKYIGLSLRI